MTTFNAPSLSPIQGGTEGIVSYMIEQSDEQVQPDINGLIGTSLKKSWSLCCLPTPKNKKESYIWDQIQSAPGIYAAGISNNGKFNEIAVDSSYLPWLFRHKFELILDHNPTEPTSRDMLYYGVYEAKTRANTHFLEIAMEACRSGPRELRWCFLETAKSRGLQIPLEWAILNHDILESGYVREKFTKNLLILGLNLLQVYDTFPALKFLSKRQGELLQLVADQSETRLTRPFFEEMQMISLVRLLFEFSGGREDMEQHKFDEDFTANENANLLCDLLGITRSQYFGRFDTQILLHALSMSKIFTDNNLQTLNIVERSLQMIDFLPIGYQQGHLNLPDQLLYRLSNGCITEIGRYIEHFYHSQTSLHLPQNNMLLLLTWSSAATGHPIKILGEWAASKDGLGLYQQSTTDIQAVHTIEQLALTLAALLCYKRLLPYCLTDTTQSIGGSYLLDFDVLVKGKALSNERAILEHMMFSLLRVLEQFSDGFHSTCQFLAEVIKTPTPKLHRFDGVSDEYWGHRMNRLSHEKAFEKTDIHNIMGYVVTLDLDEEEEWMIVRHPN